jgi:hypothetical protein
MEHKIMDTLETYQSAEDNIQVCCPQWIRRFSWDDSMKGRLCRQEFVHQYLDLPQCVCIDEVQAAPSIHEHFFGSEASYPRFEDQGMVSRARDLWWMI